MRRYLALATLLMLPACAGLLGDGPKPYVVFFTQDSAALEPTAVDVIAQAATAAKADPGKGILVLGHTDSIGSKPADVLLSQLRARKVADALVADGIPAERITQHGRGQTGEDNGLESRRVDITLTN